MIKDKPILTSFASHGREQYNAAQLRLIESSIGNWHGDYHMRTSDGYCDEYKGVKIITGGYPGNCSVHSQRPYLFKPYMIKECVDMGYTRILWCDSTIRLLKEPGQVVITNSGAITNGLWKIAAERGIVAWNNLGHPVHKWINSAACKLMGESRTNMEQQHVKQIMACCIAFDFSNPITLQVFGDWLKLGQDGAFNDVPGEPHRHDQAVLSVLLWRAGIQLMEYGDMFCYASQLDNYKDISIINQGV